MSRIAKKPVIIPKGVEVTLDGREITVKGPKGELSRTIHSKVGITISEGDGEEHAKDTKVIRFEMREGSRDAKAQAGTSRALVYNMVHGTYKGYERALKLIGVGYRARLEGKELHLTLGYSHPVVYKIPEGVSIEVPSATEVIVRGINKQKVGQAAANIREFRPPEPYKGKGICYADERVVRKDAKKK